MPCLICFLFLLRLGIAEEEATVCTEDLCSGGYRLKQPTVICIGTCDQTSCCERKTCSEDFGGCGMCCEDLENHASRRRATLCREAGCDHTTCCANHCNELDSPDAIPVACGALGMYIIKEGATCTETETLVGESMMSSCDITSCCESGEFDASAGSVLAGRIGFKASNRSLPSTDALQYAIAKGLITVLKAHAADFPQNNVQVVVLPAARRLREDEGIENSLPDRRLFLMTPRVLSEDTLWVECTVQIPNRYSASIQEDMEAALSDIESVTVDSVAFSTFMRVVQSDVGSLEAVEYVFEGTSTSVLEGTSTSVLEGTSTSVLEGTSTSVLELNSRNVLEGTSTRDEGGMGAEVIALAIGGGVLACCCISFVTCFLVKKNQTASAAAAAAPAAPPKAAPATVATPRSHKLTDEGDYTVLPADFLANVPKYWFNHSHHQRFEQMLYVDVHQHKLFDELLTVSYIPKATRDRLCPTGTHDKTPGGCPCVQPGVGLPSGYRVRRVIRVESSKMWQRYQARKEEIKEARKDHPIKQFDPPPITESVIGSHPEFFENLDASINEVYVWHGTHVRAALSIAQYNFNIDLAGSGAGTMYGQGAYCAESCTKADEYAKDDPEGYYQGVYALLLCRACMGKMYYTTRRTEHAGDYVASGDYDSTMGDRTTSGTFRELVLYSEDQLYPEYILLYSRMLPEHDPTTFEQAVNRNPFHMELPIYWQNGHLNPSTHPFQLHCLVHEQMRSMLQDLARKCCGWDVIVKSAKRIESSRVWLKYVNFKRGLHAKLSEGRASEEDDRRYLEMLGGSKQALPPGKAGFPKAQDIDVLPVTTCKILETKDPSHPLSTSYLETALNEHFLWHGTTQAVAESIAKKDFSVKFEIDAVSHEHETRFGIGAYFAEDLNKSLDYAPVEDDLRCILLCRVVAGSMFHSTLAAESDATVKAADQGHHSVFATPIGQPREFIMLEESQVYPEYILLIKEEKTWC